MLSQDMQKEYEAGNYVLCGGDFNHDLKASNDDNDDAADYESWLIHSQEKNCRSIFPSASISFLTLNVTLSGTVQEMLIWNTFPVKLIL